ncbi:MAG TPA: class I SAM-dependent methyltransferase [Burkholderiales bacterium]|nr:class I SAM-dependent methyltransferase [Burkholderiales bacterium]
MELNDQVRAFWEKEPCGIGGSIVGDAEIGTREWYERIEQHRYAAEPMIHAVAQFTRHRDKKMLEVGVGAGTDHLQWARAGCECHGVDLTDAAIETTRARLALYGLSSSLQRVDAEVLPFPDATFDLVYSWGVIHHSKSPEHIVAEIHRVLKPGGMFIGMVYGRRSPHVFKVWVRRALLRGKPWRSAADVVWHHVESIGTKSYTVKEVHGLFGAFRAREIEPMMTPYDLSRWPRWLSQFFPNRWGWFVTVRVVK